MIMKKRRLGQTDLQVSEVAFGAWQLGDHDQWGNMTDTDALNLVAKARELGCNLFDTAPNYANSNSEILLGEALANQRDDVVLVSKFGHCVDGRSDFSTKGFWTSLHGSLKRLRTDYLDVILVHSPPKTVLNGSHEIWAALAEAKQQGKIRFYGASVDYAADINEVLTTTDSQVLELMFNMLHQDVRLAFDLVKEKDVGVITKVPLDSGWLSGKYNAQSRFEGVRSRWSDNEIMQRANAIEGLKSILPEGVPLSEQALAYLLSYDEVSSVIPGMRSEQQLVNNFRAIGQQLTPEIKQQVEDHWFMLTNKGQQLLPW
jgi:aryl-alcohol dehydrogenase-like predicted oxidoreductase